MRHRNGFRHKNAEAPAGAGTCPAPTCPLNRAPNCRRLRICQLGGDRRFCARMASLGVLPGREVELLRGGDHCLIRFGDATLSLDSTLSEQILVSTE